MSLQVSVSGTQSFHRFASACHRAARSGVDKEMTRALGDAGRVVERAVRATTDDYMPRGYEQIFKNRLTTKVTVGKTTMTLIAFGKGRSGRRDVERLELGILRHPVFGRTRPVKRHWIYRGFRILNPWVPQKIRPGWFSVPVNASAPAAFAQLDAAVGRVFNNIEKAV